MKNGKKRRTAVLALALTVGMTAQVFARLPGEAGDNNTFIGDFSGYEETKADGSVITAGNTMAQWNPQNFALGNVQADLKKGVYGRAANDVSQRMFATAACDGTSEARIPIADSGSGWNVAKGSAAAPNYIHLGFSYAADKEAFKQDVGSGLRLKINDQWDKNIIDAGIRGGYIYGLGRELMDFKPNTWYRFDVIINQVTGDAKLYINGVYAAEQQITRFSSNTGDKDAVVAWIYPNFRGGAANVYLDDIVTRHCTSEPDISAFSTGLSAADGTISVDHTNLRIQQNTTLTKEQMKSALTAQSGAAVKFVKADGITELNDNDLMVTGTKVKVTSANGWSFPIYEVRDADFYADFSKKFGQSFEEAVAEKLVVTGGSIAEAKGIMPKSAADISLAADSSDGMSLHAAAVIAQGKDMTVEYSVRKDDSRIALAVNKAGGGYDYLVSETGEYNPNKWYRVAVVFKNGTANIDYYINGKKVLDNVPAGTQAFDGAEGITFTIGNAVTKTFLDDIKIYPGAYTPPPAMEISAPAGASFSIDAEKKEIVANDVQNLTVTELKDIQVANGSFAGVYASDYATPASEKPGANAVVVFQAGDGMTYDYYTISSKVGLVVQEYILSGDKISGVPFHTTLERFQSNVFVTDAAVQTGVYQGGAKVTDGYIKEGMTYQIDMGDITEVYTIVLVPAMVNQDFTEMGNKTVSGWVDTKNCPTGFSYMQLSGAELHAGNSYATFGSFAGRESVMKMYGYTTKEGSATYTNLYADYPTPITGAVNFEYSAMSETAGTKNFLGMKDSSGFWANDVLSMAADGTIKLLNKTVAAYYPGVWYDFKLMMDLDAKTASLYINGVKVVEDEYFDNISSNITHFRLQKTLVLGVENINYIDDVKFYRAAPLSYDATGEDCAITSSNSERAVDAWTSTILFREGETLEECAADLVFPDGAMPTVYDAMGTDITEELYNPAERGMYLRLVSKNGKITRDYYFVTRPGAAQPKLNMAEGKAAAAVELTNYTGEEKSFALLIAVYDGNKLAAAPVLAEKSIRYTPGTETLTVEIDIPADISNPKVKAFVWDGLKNLMPLAAAAQ